MFLTLILMFLIILNIFILWYLSDCSIISNLGGQGFLIVLYLLTLTHGGLFPRMFVILDYELTFSGASGLDLYGSRLI